MKFTNDILIWLFKLVVFVAAIALGYLATKYVIDPYIMTPNCMINNKECLTFKYYADHNNTVLIYVEPYGYWVWFDGKYAYIYDTVRSINTCSDKDKFDPVYVVKHNSFKWVPVESKCIKKLDLLKQEYIGTKKIKLKKFKHRLPTFMLKSNGGVLDTNGNSAQQLGNKFEVNDIMKIFNSKNIISLYNK